MGESIPCRKLYDVLRALVHLLLTNQKNLSQTQARWMKASVSFNFTAVPIRDKIDTIGNVLSRQTQGFEESTEQIKSLLNKANENSYEAQSNLTPTSKVFPGKHEVSVRERHGNAL